MSQFENAKSQCRNAAREAAAELSDAFIRDASAAIQDRMMALPEYQSAEAVFTYLAEDREISTETVLENCFEEGKRILLPRYLDGSYIVTEYTEGDGIICGKFGIREPASAVQAELPDSLFVVVPGLAFDRACHRLGRGGGFYDRILAGIASRGTRLFNAGLTFDCTLYPEVPIEPWDFDVDVVLTEKQSVRRSK